MLCHRARREGKAVANFTQKAIRASFIKLLNQKPLSQITIKDMVMTAESTRHTFYYYFQDLPDLDETITKEEAQRVIQLYPGDCSFEQCLDALIDFALENRKAVAHIYNSVNRDLYGAVSVAGSASNVVEVYLDGVLKERHIPNRSRQLLIDYLQCICFGFVIGWLESGMKEGIRERFARIYELKHGELERMISRCEQMSAEKSESLSK